MDDGRPAAQTRPNTLCCLSPRPILTQRPARGSDRAEVDSKIGLWKCQKTSNRNLDLRWLFSAVGPLSQCIILSHAFIYWSLLMQQKKLHNRSLWFREFRELANSRKFRNCVTCAITSIRRAQRMHASKEWLNGCSGRSYKEVSLIQHWSTSSFYLLQAGVWFYFL